MILTLAKPSNEPLKRISSSFASLLLSKTLSIVVTLAFRKTETMNRTNNYKALVLLFPGFNTLDMAGPLEVLKMSADRELFSVTIAAEDEITTSFESVQVKVYNLLHLLLLKTYTDLILQRDIPIDDALLVNIELYDVLVVPGGPLAMVETQAKKLNQPFMKAIQVFKNSPVSEFGFKALLYVTSSPTFLD